MESDSEKLLAELLVDFHFMDDCHIKGDHNTILKKIHEGIAKIKQHKGVEPNE